MLAVFTRNPRVTRAVFIISGGQREIESREREKKTGKRHLYCLRGGKGWGTDQGLALAAVSSSMPQGIGGAGPSDMGSSIGSVV